MSLSDPIGDMIARIKNAQARNHKKVELPSSNFKSKIADILKNEGFIKDFKVAGEEKKPILSLEPKINNGLGIAIVSTPKGVMTDMDARKQKIGGEIICKVF
jgi:small subunit ribosomal protein S8